jgi:CRP/FNR family transcriptional regulator, dissimilatory nitrate respiration regulator
MIHEEIRIDLGQREVILFKKHGGFVNPIEKIATIPLFEGLPRKQHESLARIAISRFYKKGEVIFSEGDDGIGFYVIVSGRVKIFKLSPDGKEQILHFFGPPETFGEVPVFSGHSYPAYAEATGASQLLFFPKGDFVSLIRTDPSMALNMLAVLSARLRRFAAQVEELSLKEVPGRLAAYLLFLSQRSDNGDMLDLDITKGQLASLLGTIPETLSRVLGKMSRQKFIHSQGSRLKILDRQGLEAIAAGERKLL